MTIFMRLQADALLHGKTLHGKNFEFYYIGYVAIWCKEVLHNLTLYTYYYDYFYNSRTPYSNFFKIYFLKGYIILVEISTGIQLIHQNLKINEISNLRYSG